MSQKYAVKLGGIGDEVTQAFLGAILQRSTSFELIRKTADNVV